MTPYSWGVNRFLPRFKAGGGVVYNARKVKSVKTLFALKKNSLNPFPIHFVHTGSSTLRKRETRKGGRREKGK
jgi:hypothetical protein